MQFIGQRNNIEIINNWKTMPPFIIIQGDAHMGKTYLTLYLCKKFGCYYYKASNKMNDIRNLLDMMTPNSNMLFHFKDFHNASINAKNNLLKITEEPVKGNYIVITGGPQLKTLESRARKLIVNPYDFSEIDSYMSFYYDDELFRKSLYECGINSPAKVEYYQKYEKLEKISIYAHNIAEKITYINPNDILDIMTHFENKYDNSKIDACLLFLSMLINIIDLKIKDKYYYSFKNQLNCLIEGKRSLERQPTLKRKMLLYNIFYSIYMFNKENKEIK